MCSLSTKALKCHKSNIKNQLKNLTQQDKIPVNLKYECVHILIREFLRTALQCGLPSIRYFPVSYVHYRNKKSYYNCHYEGQEGIWGLRVLLSRITYSCWEN
jgi:hypothetical protein